MSNLPFVVAITGSSGAVYGLRLVQALVELREPVIYLLSEPARTVLREELGIDVGAREGAELSQALFAPAVAERLQTFLPSDFAAPVSSGSFQTRALIVCPASMASVGRFAAGLTTNLIDRAFDVALKERRPIVLVPRETPLSSIHLENLLKLSRLGVTILPASPAFYHNPSGITELLDFVCGKVLDSVGLQHDLFKRWRSHEPPFTRAKEVGAFHA